MARQPVRRILIHSGSVFYVRDLSSDYHCQHGRIAKADLMKRAGSRIRSNTGREFVLLRPGFRDQLARMRRGPQIIPAKDVGAILAMTGIGKTSAAVDAGCGSGALALSLSQVAKRVTSYEVREDFFRIAEENKRLLKAANLTLKNQDITLGIDERSVDLVTLDLPEPWKAIPHAHAALKPGGWLVSYSPSVPQAMDFLASLGERFMHVRTIELIEREWEFEGRKVRPRSRMLGHSGFLSFCRKV
ncbi:methyltransferase domain-containing protein [Candidatus Woesearchaeota archaeon]|nr:methyltransferase domain-containing protein [Candidatus Woesearchaeota archaeon]